MMLGIQGLFLFSIALLFSRDFLKNFYSVLSLKSKQTQRCI